MRTKRQEELVDSFLSVLGDETRPVYRDIIACLSELGYSPRKQRSQIVFKHDRHNKQIAKAGIRVKSGSPFFALRFSACRDYSERFRDIVREAVSRENYHQALCLSGGCRFCGGQAVTHVYTYTAPDGERRSHCGAYALEIPGITAADVAEIKALIKEENAYLLEHEAGMPPV